MKRPISLLLTAVCLLALFTSCKKKTDEDIELTPTQGRLRMDFKYNTSIGPVVPFSCWGVATSERKMFDFDFLDEGVTNITGRDTTKQLDPGTYHVFGWEDWNGDSIGGFSSAIELKASNTPLEVVVPLVR